jgi:beta-lactamase superfamily II metal-dependent hydrolase
MNTHKLIKLSVCICLIILITGCIGSEKTQQSSLEQVSSEQSTNIQNTVAQKGNLTVYYLDVGQGDSILIEYSGKTMLIDAGESDMGPKVASFLKDQGITYLDYVVATHAHADHVGGMTPILNEYPVGQFIDSGVPHTSATYEKMLTKIDEKNIPFHVAQRGEKIDFAPGVDVEVLNPGTDQNEDLNENSVVLKLTDGSVSFLFMGDAGLEAEESIMEDGYNIDAAILKVGHHSSTSGSGQRFISAVSPEVSIIEVGAGNDYGHPHKETLQRLQQESIVYRTDQSGNIMITTDGERYTIRTEKGSSVDSTVVSSTQNVVSINDLNLKEEWIAITNSGKSSVDLSGWWIKDKAGNMYTFPSFSLSASSTVTIYTSEGKDGNTELYWNRPSAVWNNDGDTAYLYNSNGEIIDSYERNV